MIGASAAVLGLSAILLGTAVASAARDAQQELRALLDEASGLSIASLLEPGTYAVLAESATRTEEAMQRLNARLRALGPLELIPFAGGRVRAARNTAALGRELASAGRRVIEAYGDAVDERLAGGPAAVEAALRQHREALEETEDALARAASLATGPLVLDLRDATLVNATIGALRSLTAVAIASPASVDDGLELLQRLFDLQELITDPLAALTETSAASRHIAAVRQRSAALTAALGRLAADEPETNETLELALDGLVIISEAAEAAAAMLSIGEALENGFLSPAFGTEAAPLLATARDRLDAAKLRLERLEASFASWIGGQLADAGVIGGGTRRVFGPAHDALDETSDAVAATASLLGFDGPRTYLLILQNQNEIRATGGFIGATIEVHIVNGVLGDLVFEDSTSIDLVPLANNPPAPEPLYWYLWMGRLLFRDANWNPDFPTSARTLLDFYEANRGVDIDGVVAGTKLLALDMVDAIGGVRVPGVDALLTRDIASRYIEGELPYACEPRHVSVRSKRCFDEDLVPALVDRLKAGFDDDLRREVIDVFREHLGAKNVLIFMTEEATQAFVSANGWDGAVPRPPQDFLMVIDSSLPGHTTAAIRRSWDYRVSLVPDGSSAARLYIRYENTRPVLDPDCRQAAEGGGGCYWNYARVFLPPAAELVEAPIVPLHEGSEKLIWGHRDLRSEQVITHAGSGLQGLVEVGGYVVVEPGTVLTLPLAYSLRANVIRSVGPGRYEYRLLLAKQPGIDDDRVSVRVQLPEGARVVTVSPPSVRADGNTVTWEHTLVRDSELIVVFESP
ncbi:MAG: DUF4012 domain-containing protein [Chloroflexi bacterium]|nr:DUF4012 domain-containing protein [Chloroflexota bacterium]